MDVKTHLRFWAAIFAFCIFLGPLIKNGKDMELFAWKEVQATRNVFGDNVGEWILKSATKLFEHGPSQAIVQYARLGTVTTEREKEIRESVWGVGGSAMAKAANSYFTGLILLAYIMAIRMLILLIWFGVLSPVVIAAIIDGLSMRAVRYYQFLSARPAAYSLLALLLIPMAFAPVLYLVIPMHIDPALVPAWVLVCAIPISVLISHKQAVFGEY